MKHTWDKGAVSLQGLRFNKCKCCGVLRSVYDGRFPIYLDRETGETWDWAPLCLRGKPVSLTPVQSMQLGLPL